jgi:hypothetical protein
VTNRKTIYAGPVIVIGLVGALVMWAWEKARGRWQ